MAACTPAADCSGPRQCTWLVCTALARCRATSDTALEEQLRCGPQPPRARPSPMPPRRRVYEPTICRSHFQGLRTPPNSCRPGCAGRRTSRRGARAARRRRALRARRGCSRSMPSSGCGCERQLVALVLTASICRWLCMCQLSVPMTLNTPAQHPDRIDRASSYARDAGGLRGVGGPILRVARGRDRRVAARAAAAFPGTSTS